MMTLEAAAEARIIGYLVEQVRKDDPFINPATVEGKVRELFEDINKRDVARSRLKVTDEIIRARGDCLIFFDLVTFGWGKTKRLSSGAVVAIDAPVSFDERRGFPTRYRLWTASKRVHETCPEEAAQYKQAWRDWREARKRYLATETEEDWQWYRSGKGNRNSVAYRSKVDLNRRGGEQHFRTRRLFKYTINELLPHHEERERAYRELLEAQNIMSDMRARIFEKMGVPPEFRC
jgi:hypothetical protein